MLVSFGLTACGGSDDPSEPQSLAFTAAPEGDGVKVTGPTTAESGLAGISFQNDGDKESDLQLIRTEGDESVDDAVEATKSAIKGDPVPDWLLLAGGVGATAADESQSVTQVLEPGTYYAFDTSGQPNSEFAATIEVDGDAFDETVEADAEISAFEYGFETDGLTTGMNQILFKNTGAQPHHIIYAPIVGDATVADLEESIKSESGPPPIDEKKVKSTAVLEGGTDQLIDVDFAEPGRYALICFISDRQGGPPHALKGMIAEVDVE